MSQFSNGWSPLPPGAAGASQPPPQAAGGGAGQTSPSQGGLAWSCNGNTYHPPPGYDTVVSNVGWWYSCTVQGVQIDYPQGPVYYSPKGPLSPVDIGPFGSWLDAVKGWCAQCKGGPPPPQSPPPLSPTYFNVCYDTGGGGRGIIQKLAASGDAAMQLVTGALAAFGPYYALAVAEKNADADLESCVGSHPHPPATPTVSCKINTDLWLAIPEPGSVDWCAAQETIFAAVKKLGLTIISLVEGGLNAVDDWLLGLANTELPDSCGVTNLLTCFWSYLKSYGSYIPERVVCGLKWVVAVIKNGLIRPATCDITTYSALVAVKAFWNFCKNADIGSDVYVLLHTKYGEPIPLIDRVLDYLLEYACPTHVPWIHEAIEASLQGELTDEQYQCWMRMSGASPSVWEPIRRSRRERLADHEIIRWSRQFAGSDEDADFELKDRGWIDDGERKAKLQLYDELPSIADHLEWLRKNVFDQEYVNHFRLLDGFGSKQDLSDAGYSDYVDPTNRPYQSTFWGRFGADLYALGMKKEYAALHYAAHWINPSFTQQFQMVQRLRPGRVDPSLVFTKADLLRTMQEMDVGTYFRERLEAVSHPLPNLTLCLSMYQYGQVTDDEFVQKLMDLGYSEPDSKQILGAQIVKVRRLNASSGHGWTPAAMAPAYAVGKLTAQQIYDEMSYLGYRREDADRLMRRAEIELATSPIRRTQQLTIRSALVTQSAAYKCGSIDADTLRGAYTSAGIPASVAAIAVSDVDASVAVDLCRKQISSFRSALLRGKVTVDQLRAIMLGASMPALRVEQYLKTWVTEAGLKAPQATAAQILRWVGLGMLDRDTASLRLLNLGWTDPDLTLLIAESLGKLARGQEAIQRQAARSQQASARAALRLAQQAQSTANQLRSRLRGIASRPQLQKWYKEGLIDDAYFIEAMHERGYDDDSTLKYLAEAELARAKAAKPPKTKAAPTVQSNGTSQG